MSWISDGRGVEEFRGRSRCVARRPAFTLASAGKAFYGPRTKQPPRRSPRQGVGGGNIVDSVHGWSIQPPTCVPPRRPRGHDLELVRRGFSHRSNWMSIAEAASRFPPAWGIVRMAFSTVNLMLLRA